MVPLQVTGFSRAAREELDLLLEQRVVVAQVVAEQWERFGEGAASEDDLGPAVGEGVHGREPLEDPDRVVRAQHGHAGGQPDAGRAWAIPASTVSGVEIANSGRWCSPRAMTSTPSLIRENRLLDDLPDRRRVGHRAPESSSGTSPKVSSPER